jgi:RecB family endonuclease NucS
MDSRSASIRPTIRRYRAAASKTSPGRRNSARSRPCCAAAGLPVRSEIVPRRAGDLSEKGNRVRIVRLLVARCEVRYTGRLTAVLPEAVRLLILKADGSVLVHDDAGGYKPLNWMTGPTFTEELGDVVVVRKAKTEDVLEIRLVEVLSDVVHDMGESAALQKDGAERDLQELLAAAPSVLGDGMTLVKREWPTEVGPVDLMCRDEDGAWVAVEIKRIGTIEAVEQLTRYLGFIREDPAKAGCRGVLAAQTLKPQAVALAESRDMRCVEVDLAVLRGEREPELTLFQ